MISKRRPLGLFFFAMIGGGCTGAGGIGEGTRSSPFTCQGTSTATIQATVFAISCASAGCHGSMQPALGLDLVSPDLEGRIVNAPANGCDKTLIVPGHPTNSYFLEKLTSTAPTCGEQMPLGVAHMSTAEIDCLTAWVMNLTVSPSPDAGPDTPVVDATNRNPVDTAADAAGSTTEAGPSCPSGQTTCGSRCVALDKDNTNCGACGTACASGQFCNAGRCACQAGLVLCGGACVDLSTSNGNCGTCGRTCPSGVCAAGACASSCPTGTTNCGGSCVNLSTSSANCGACGKVCSTGTACTAGACQCPSGQTLCGGASCVNTTIDPSNCGTCGKICPAGASCSNATCTCPSGKALCSSSCVNLGTDPSNCGACGKVCASGQTCAGGVCGCGATVSFANQVQPIFTSTCASGGCHSGTRPSANLSLSSGASYKELVNVVSSCAGRLLVVPGAVPSSYLMNKLLGSDLCSGSKMPKAGTSLPSMEIAAISGWICEGAPNN